MNKELKFEFTVENGSDVIVKSATLAELEELSDSLLTAEFNQVVTSYSPEFKSRALSKLNMEQLKEVADNLLGLTAEEIYNLLDDKSNLSANEWYDFSEPEEFFNFYFADKEPWNIASAIAYGRVNFSDAYVRFDGDENLETTHSLDFESEFEAIVAQWIEENIEF